MGFAGEICFVKPGYALNSLVPKREALFFSDPKALTYASKVDQDALVGKQRMRNLQIFLSKLKDMKLVFQREVSEINKNVATNPVEASEVLDTLNKRYNLGIKREDFKMEQGLDTIGEHFVTVTYQSEQFSKDFTFFVKVQIRPKKVVAAAEKASATATTSV